MNNTEFVNKIMLRFPPAITNGDTVESYIADYITAINTNEIYDYDAAFIDLMRSYSFKTTPPPKIVLEILKQHKIRVEVPNTETTETAIVVKNKTEYEFGYKPSEYLKAIDFFKREGFTLIKIKYCDKNCMRCGFNHVCSTAKELKA